MNLLMISGDRMLAAGKKGAFYNTLEAFHTHWDRIDVICPKSDSAQVRELFGNVFLHPSPKGIWYQKWWIYKKGKELFAEHHHDIATVHEYPPFYNGIGAWMLKRATGLRYVTEIHHIIGYPIAASFVERIGHVMMRTIFRLIVRPAIAVRTVNQSVADVLHRYGVPSEKITIVPSFYLDPSKLIADPTVTKTADLICCGRLVPNKGFEAVIDAVSRMPQVRLHIIGDGPMRGTLEKLADALAVADRVEFHGWLPAAEDVYHTMQQGKVFVMNSTSEGGPRVALEAMALGLCVVSTRVGVMQDVIEDGVNGLFTKGTPADLYTVLSDVLRDDAKRIRIGEEAKKILHTFNRDALIEKYAQFLQSLA